MLATVTLKRIIFLDRGKKLIQFKLFPDASTNFVNVFQ